MSDTPPCLGCGAPTDCDQPDQYAFSLTGDPTLPFVLNCPAGFNCNQALTLKLNCCGHILSASKAGNATNPQVSAILRALILQCAQFNNQCGLVLPKNTILQNTIFATVGQCTIFCPDGAPFTYTEPQTLYLGVTQQQADFFAHQTACRDANQHLVCIGTLPTTLPENVAFSQVLLATGFLAVAPLKNHWVITGDIPTGMTFTGGDFLTSSGPTLTGTPTTVATYEFTVSVTNPSGDTATKDFSIQITGPIPAEYWSFSETGNGTIPRVGKVNGLQMTAPTGGGSSATDVSGVPALITNGVQFLCPPSTFPVANAPTLQNQSPNGAITFNSAIGTGFTFAYWSKPVYFDAINNQGGFVASNVVAHAGSFNIGVSALFSGTLTLQFAASGASTFNMNAGSVSSTWHHIAITYLIAGGIITYYFDGAAIHSQSGVSIATMLSGTVAFHEAFQNAGTFPPSNLLDEAFFSGRICATAGQISKIYNGGAGCTYGDGIFPFTFT